jgi:signal transduction histidine kinase
MEGYGLWLDPLRVEIAIARGALAEVERLLGEMGPRGLDDPDGLIARLNALVVLGRRAEIKAEAPAAVKPRTYLEPFALRALGFARTDEKLIAQSIQRFEAMGMAWHAAETKKLLPV